MRENSYLALIAVLVPFSLISVGGGPTILAGLQHQAVEVHQWVAGREFVDLFALARAAPGPGSMIVTLLGWKVAGWSGALVATLAFYAPSSLLCYTVANIWNRYRGRSWHGAFERGMAPVAAGLLFAGSLAIARLADAGIAYWVVALAALAMLIGRPRFNILVLLVAGGIALSLWETFVP